MDSLLYIENLEKTIDDFHFGPIDLSIEPGTITALVGNNSSGKSTLFKLIMNLAKPEKGNIKINNLFTHGEKEDWKTLIAYQPQTVIGWDPFTGNVLKEMIAPLYPSWDDELFNKMVDQFNIPLNKKFGKLSQGVQQKLNLALTLPRNTPLLLLDEPTSFMDIPSKKILMDFIVDWMEPGDRSIIIASHQIDDIRKLSDYLFVLHNGKFLGHFEKEELIENHARYWITSSLEGETIPGVVFQEGNVIISNRIHETESYLKTNNMKWSNRSTLELDDIITLLLTQNKQ